MQNSRTGASTKIDIIQFEKHLPIELSYENAECYFKCSRYNPEVLHIPQTWHQIVIRHKNKLPELERKQVILDAIFAAVDGEEFYPVAYRLGDNRDMFLVRQCKAALDKLFQKNLTITLESHQITLLIEVQFNVGSYKREQLSAHTSLSVALNGLLNCLETYKDEKGILNLSHFDENQEFDHISVNLGNRGVFERVCEVIYKNDKFRYINGLLLNNNNITNLEPLKIFNDISLVVLDLSNNKLQSVESVCKDLKRIKSCDLFLFGNPFTMSPDYRNAFQDLFKNFSFVDNIAIEKLRENGDMSDVKGEINYEGYRIDWTNKDDIVKFKDSNQWHAVVIPDSECAYDRNSIIGFFFLSFPENLSEFYPCYYKYSHSEHRFLLLNCYEQLFYFTELCQLQIKMPNFSAHTDPNQNQNQILSAYLMMNVMPLKEDQVEFSKALDKALKSRFRLMTRVLDLNNFQMAEGLECIIVNMSCPKILRRVLATAARKFLSKCVEVRLSNNQILKLNQAKVFAIMGNLKVIDLGNNWIHDLNAIKDLNNLNLRSLRLDGNPVCSKYASAGEYIKAVKEVFPTLAVLDNQDISSKGYLVSQKNYLCSVDAYDFVSEFVPLYFNLFEKKERKLLLDLYDPYAIMSFSCDYNINNSPVHIRERIAQYSSLSTNVLKKYSARRSNLIGQAQIASFLNSLPEVKHDMLSITTDLVLFNPYLAILMVTGVLKEESSHLKDEHFLLAFSKTFFLKPVKCHTGPLKCGVVYKITNEYFNITNPGPYQLKNCFQCIVKSVTDVTEAADHDEEAMIAKLQQITGLKIVWCARCLEDAEWNFEKSLEIFEKLCNENKIPESAFK